MKSKLGFHVDIAVHRGQPEKMVRAGTRLIKVISSMALLRDLHRDLGDNTIFIARDWKVTDDFMRFGAHEDPKGAAKRWLDGMRPAIEQAPFAYWESFNEMAAWDYLREYGEFEAERQRLMAEEGFKACLFNFAVGTPDIDGPNDKWPLLYPALEAAHQYNNILGLHEYGDLYMDTWYGPNQSAALRSGQRVPFPEEHAEGWLFGRYRKVWNLHLKPNGWTNVRIALTEFGIAPALTPDITAIVGAPTGAWRNCVDVWRRLDGRGDGEQFYVEQLQWCDRQMHKDHYVIGAAIFTWGTLGDWANFEIEGKVADTVVAYIERAEFEPVPIDPDDGEVPDVVVETYLHITPISTIGLWVRSGPGVEHEAFTVAHPGDRLRVLEPEAEALAKLGKEGQWVHIQMPSGEEGYVAAWLVEKPGSPPLDDPTPGKLYITPNVERGVFVRNGPSYEHDKIASVFIGDQLEVLTPRDEVMEKIGQEDEWLKIRTPHGINGWIAAQYVELVGAPGGNGEEEEGPIYLRVTVPSGLYVRSGPGPQHGPIASALPGDRLEALGDPRDVRARLGKQGQWVQIKTPEGAVGWSAAWFLEEVGRYYVWSGGHALVGLHGPADPGERPWDEEAFQVVRRARVEAVKLHAAGDIGGNVVRRLHEEGVKFIMARLFAKFHSSLTPQEFVRDVADAALRLYDNGIRYFEVHNEPNLHKPDAPEGMWVAWQSGKEFGRFFQDSVEILRGLMPGAQFGFPGLSPGSDEEGVRASSVVFLAQADAAVRGADFVCMHTYWGADGTTYLDSIKAIKAFCDQFPDKLIFVTEFSNPDPNVGKDIKGREYVQFYTEAKKLPSNLGGLFAFVLSSWSGFEDETWKGSDIADRVGRR